MTFWGPDIYLVGVLCQDYLIGPGVRSVLGPNAFNVTFRLCWPGDIYATNFSMVDDHTNERTVVPWGETG